MTDLDENKQVIRGAFEALNSRDREAFVGIHTKDCLLHNHNEEVRGIDAITEQQFEIFDGFPDMRYNRKEILAEGDLVACRWQVSGTHEGTFESIPPTDQRVEVTASGIFRLRDGKVAEVWLNYDRLGMMEQLGVIEPPET